MQTKVEKNAEPQFDYSVAMLRLMYVVGVGYLPLLIFSLGSVPVGGARVLSVFSVGLMAASAALLAGGLLGFLFGVPHTREGESRQAEGGKGHQQGTEQQGESKTRGPSASGYRPSTSLEQISDWLTKILVGVGLVEIRTIRETLTGMAAYIAKGLGDGDSAKALAFTVLIYFSVCGFVFGFLWARLYLEQWYRLVDLQGLGEQIIRLEGRIDPILEKETESEPSSGTTALADQTSSLTDNEKKLLQQLATGKWILRTRTGLAASTGIERSEVGRIVEDLKNRGLVDTQMVVDRRGAKGKRWYITNIGREVIA